MRSAGTPSAIDRVSLDALFGALEARGYTLVGPTVRDRARPCDPAPGARLDARTGFDPRALAIQYRWFRISPRRIQAWREVNELEAGQIEPGEADRDREGGPAQQMETR